MRATIDAVAARLTDERGLVYRYRGADGSTARRGRSCCARSGWPTRRRWPVELDAARRDVRGRRGVRERRRAAVRGGRRRSAGSCSATSRRRSATSGSSTPRGRSRRPRPSLLRRLLPRQAFLLVLELPGVEVAPGRSPIAAIERPLGHQLVERVVEVLLRGRRGRGAARPGRTTRSRSRHRTARPR